MTNKELLKDLIKYDKKHPGLRFFQLLTNYFHFSFLGTAKDMNGSGFRDLWEDVNVTVDNPDKKAL